METKEKLELLYDKLDAADCDHCMAEIAEEILAIDPRNPQGKLALWQSMDYDESMDNIEILEEALDRARAIVQSKDEAPDLENNRDDQTYCAILTNLGYTMLQNGNSERAYELGRELAEYDAEEYFPNRTLLYRAMLDLQMYNDILTTVENDPQDSVVGQHAKVISLIECGADDGVIRDEMIYALSFAPDVPFYILGIWEMPEPGDPDITEEDEYQANCAAYLADPWCANDKRVAILSGPAYVFGYLTGRLDDEKEIRALKQFYEMVGIEDDVEAAKARIEEMRNDGRDWEEVDSNALGEAAQLVEKMALGK